MRPLEQDAIADFFARTNCPRRKYASGLLELGFPNLREGNPLHMTLQKDDFNLNSCLGNLRRTHETPERVPDNLQPTIGQLWQKANNA
jgi:hypothetical protein